MAKKNRERQPRIKSIRLEDLNPPEITLTPSPVFKARSEQQRQIFQAYNNSDILMLTGPADTAKTFSACLLAWRDIQNGVRKKIIVFRPAVDAGENLGYDAGDFNTKLAPWLIPIHESLKKIAGRDAALIEHIVVGKSLGRIRGETFESAVVIVTEAQNATEQQLRLVCTRFDKESKIIIEGDMRQLDLPHGKSGLPKCIDVLSTLPRVSYMKLVEEPEGTPNCRHPLVRKITQAWV